MYVSARQVYLHDRVAAVSNRVGVVTNGQALLVLEKGKRFTKVQTPKGEVGWLEDHSIIDDKLYAQFDDLNKKHHDDAPVARGTLRDDLYLHLLPGRETAHFLVLPGNTKLDLLQRGSVAKTAPGAPPAPAPVATPKPATAHQGSARASGASAAAANSAVVNPAAPPPVMEDWWLVRDSSGRCGWLLARQIDVDVPDEVAIYAEGQRMVAAYPLTKVMDSGVERKAAKKGGKATRIDLADEPAPTAASTEHLEYVTVLAPPRNGLPYDYDQIRVFTWSLNHHRYETAFRMRGVRGYLPVTIGRDPSLRDANGQPAPTFTAEIAPGPGAHISIDPDTGVIRPSAPRKISFRLEGNLIRRIGPDLAPIAVDHEGEEAEPGKSKPAKRKRR
ncbi:MAG TPA: SH3 domain-containing protein [Acidobacteriaceae bacterium]|nr:SH3 domain-containing protein [Acidobacteriaceae bacterium]